MNLQHGEFMDSQFIGFSTIAISAVMFHATFYGLLSGWTLTGYLFSCFWNKNIISQTWKCHTDNDMYIDDSSHDEVFIRKEDIEQKLQDMAYISN